MIRSSLQYAIVIVSLFIICVFSMRACYVNRQTVIDQNTAILAMNDTVRHYRDNAGHEHAVTRSVVADATTINAIKAHILDSVSKAIKVPKKDIQGVTTVTNKDSGKITVPIPSNNWLKDSTKTPIKFSYADRWLAVEGEITDSLRMFYATSDSIIIARYTKTTGNLFHRHTDEYINGYNINPNGSIMGIQDVRISSQKAKKWAVVAGGGYGVNPTGIGFFGGVTVGVKLFEW